MYYFCRPQAKSLEPWVGACHASELTSVFGNLHLDVDGEAKKTLSARVSGAFVNFARYGDPNGKPGAVPGDDQSPVRATGSTYEE